MYKSIYIYIIALYIYISIFATEDYTCVKRLLYRGLYKVKETQEMEIEKEGSISQGKKKIHSNLSIMIHGIQHLMKIVPIFSDQLLTDN